MNLNESPMTKILVVDDDPLNRDIMLELFSNTPYEKLACESGEECLELIDNYCPDVILLDIMMPGINGYEVCEKIKNEFSHLLNKIILVSGKAMSSERLDGYKVGADDYVSKPFDHDELLAKVNVYTRLNQLEKELRNKNKNLQEMVDKQTQQLLQSEKLASIGQLAAGVAHEINNPMCFIKNNLETLKDYLHDLILIVNKVSSSIEDSPEANSLETLNANLKSIKDELDFTYISEDSTDIIKESLQGTDRIAKIVNNLKNFARNSDEELKLDNINSTIEKALSLVWNQVKTKCTLNKEFEEIPDALLYHDKLIQVFVNLLMNAAQAIETKGEVSVTTRLHNENIIVIVSDTGCGMPEEVITNAFNPFYTTKPMSIGTGLGLYISYEIVQAHNGNIEITSKEGQGTSFTITLPMNLTTHD